VEVAAALLAFSGGLIKEYKNSNLSEQRMQASAEAHAATTNLDLAFST